MAIDEVRKHVEDYFRQNLTQYTVLEIRRKSSHPDDTHLWMVSAQKSDGTYAVWTSWNESTKSLNDGHYDLTSIDTCEKIFEEYQDIHPYCEIYKCSQNAKLRLFVAETEEAAKKFCEEHNWELQDENGFIWDLDYDETSCHAPSANQEE